MTEGVVDGTGSGRALYVGSGAGRPTRAAQPESQYKALSEDTGGVFTFLEHRLLRNYPLHIHHAEDEGVYMLEGRVTACVGDETFEIGPGDFLFMPRGVPHSLAIASDTTPRFVGVSAPGGIEHLMDDLTELTAAGHRRSSPEWRELEAKHKWTLL